MSAAIGQEDYDRDRRIFERGQASRGDYLPAAHSKAVAEVIAELGRAAEKFAPFNSPHEGWAVIKEELDELWEHVRGNTGRGTEARHEAMQVAAMALRYMADLSGGSE